LKGVDYSVSPPIVYELSDNPIFTGRYVVKSNQVIFMEDASNEGVNILVESNYTSSIIQQPIDASGIPYLKSRIPQAKYFKIDSYYYNPYVLWSSDGITYNYDTNTYTDYRDSSGVYWSVFYGSVNIATTQVPITNTLRQLMGYSSYQLKSRYGFSASDLYLGNYSIQNLKDVSFAVFDVKYAGYTISQLTAEYSEAELTQSFIFDISNSVWNNTYPIVNAGGSFVDISGNAVQSGIVSTNGNTNTVSWKWVFYNNLSVNDGLSFNTNVVSYGNHSSINITKFDGIPLCNMDNSANASFYGFAGIISATDSPKIVNPGMVYCFENSVSANLGSIGNWDTSTVTNMNGVFKNAVNFNQQLYWKTDSVTNMSDLFYGASTYEQPTNTIGNVNLGSGMVYTTNSSWNVLNVTNMSGMFYGASNYNHPINKWNTSNVTNMNNMFFGASKFNQSIDTSSNYYSYNTNTSRKYFYYCLWH
jgi:surface protein